MLNFYKFITFFRYIIFDLKSKYFFTFTAKKHDIFTFDRPL
jgi:hypothetical protein